MCTRTQTHPESQVIFTEFLPDMQMMMDVILFIYFGYKNVQFMFHYISILAKRRNANHPCPVCGKFYVNEGSLRKHLACHPEMANQLSSSLRMWPCTVCTAVFTHENGNNT